MHSMDGNCCAMLRRAHKNLVTTDLLFGSVSMNIILIVINLIQVFGSIVFLSLLEKSSFDFSTVWWILIDGSRVLVATIVRIESLLKEGENERICIRKTLFYLNVLGLVWGVLVSVCIITIFNDSNSFAFEILAGSICCVHILTTLPPLFTVTKEPHVQAEPLIGNYEQIVDVPEQQNHPVYLPPTDYQNSEQQQLNNDNNNDNSNNQSNVNTQIAQQQLIWQIIQQNNQRDAVRQVALEEERLLREQQDMEYAMMETEHAHLNQISNQTETQINEEEKIQEVEPEEPSTKILEPKEEPEKSSDTIVLRFRLPDGTSLKRRFLHYNTFFEVHQYVDWELHKRKLVTPRGYRLLTRAPRTVYDDLDATLEETGLWMAGKERECVSPMLYCDEIIS